jgi:hypothetical protein
VLGGLAEFERELIRARTGEGRKRAKDRGVKFGRPRKMTPHQRQEALQRLNAGETMADVARTYAVDPATISRLAASSPFEHSAVGCEGPQTLRSHLVASATSARRCPLRRSHNSLGHRWHTGAVGLSTQIAGFSWCCMYRAITKSTSNAAARITQLLRCIRTIPATAGSLGK